MDIKHIHTALIAAETGSYREAARRKGITQPAVSQQIRSLEGQLGLLLFQRKGRGVELTEQGATLIDNFRSIFHQSEELRRRAGMLKRQELGTVRIGYSTSLMYENRLPRTISDFVATYPGVDVQIDPMLIQDAVDDLGNHEIDLAILRAPLPPLPGEIEATVFSRSAMVLVAPRGHPLARRDVVEPDALNDQTFLTILDPPGVGLRHMTEKFLALHGIKVRQIHFIPDMTTLNALQDADMGLALLPREIAMSRAGVATVKVRGPELTTEGYVLHHRSPGGAYVRHLIQRLTRSPAGTS